MSEKLVLIRLPILLILIFCVGKLIVGATGGSYELGTRLFAMVPLTVHLCLIWGALTRAYHGYGAGAAMVTGLLIALVAQILILVATSGSYLLGVETHFNNPVAMVGESRVVSFGEALAARTGGLVINGIIGAVAGLIGWALGGLLPSGRHS
ncbi:MAG: hypothetical protein ACE5JX_12680 [Acidobacteriota bacterium]